MRAPSQDTLWIGTTRKNLPGILRDGLVPNAGDSLHRTRSTGNVYLAGEPEAALLYADAHTIVGRRNPTQHEPALIEVGTRGLDLEPDWDDLALGVAGYLEALGDASGLNAFALQDEVLTDDQAAALEDAIEELQQQEWVVGPYGSVEWFDEGLRLTIVPVHGLPIADVHGNTELLDDGSIGSDSSGDPVYEATQYLHRGALPLSRVKGIYIPARRAKTDMTLTSYGHVVKRPGGGLTWRTIRFRRLSIVEARRLVGRRR